MHYGIIGMGPVGTVFATQLKKAGHKVTALCRNPLRAEYFLTKETIISGHIHSRTKLDSVVTDLYEFIRKEPDIVMICTKSCHSREILRAIRNMQPKESMIFLACQNGLSVEDQISEIFSPEKAWRMVLNFGCNFVRHNEVWVEFCFDHYLSENSYNLDLSRQISEDFNAAGISHKHGTNFKEEAFKKAILNSALGSTCALTRMTMKSVMDEKDLYTMVREIVRESIKVAQGLGLGIDSSYENLAMEYLKKGGDHKPSLLVDIERNRQTENENHCGMLYQHAKNLGIEVPVTQSLYYLIKNLEKTLVLNSYVSEGMKNEIER